MLLCLWCRLAAEALIQALAGELQYAAGVAIKKKKSILFFMILFTIFLDLILDAFALFFFLTVPSQYSGPPSQQRQGEVAMGANEQQEAAYQQLSLLSQARLSKGV